MSEQDVPARCAPFDEDLSAWLDGELAASASSALRDHVAGCERCSARSQELRAVDQRLRAIAAATPSASEAVRLARLRTRLTAERAQLEQRPPRAVDPARAAAVTATPVQRAPVPRRRWLPAALAAATAAVLAGMLVAPSLLDDLLSTTESDFAQQRSAEAPRRDRASAPSMPSAAREPSAPAPAPAEPVAPVAQLTERSSRTPGHAGSSVDPGAAESVASADASADAPAGVPADATARAPAGAPARALTDAAAESPTPTDDAIALARELDELASAAPGDLAVVEQLPALARMSDRPAPDARPSTPPPAPKQEATAQLPRVRAMAPVEREQMRANLERWRVMTPGERSAARERWQRFQELPVAEQRQLLGGDEGTLAR